MPSKCATGLRPLPLRPAPAHALDWHLSLSAHPSPHFRAPSPSLPAPPYSLPGAPPAAPTILRVSGRGRAIPNPSRTASQEAPSPPHGGRTDFRFGDLECGTQHLFCRVATVSAGQSVRSCLLRAAGVWGLLQLHKLPTAQGLSLLEQISKEACFSPSVSPAL